MTTEEKIRQEITALNQSLGVISTVNKEGNPESAAVYYVCDQNLTLYFITRSESSKYKNIENNPHVSFVMTSEHPPHTIQIQGIAQPVIDAHEENENFSTLVKMASDHLTMAPVSQIPDGQVMFMKITPTWIRYGNFEVWTSGDKFIEVKK